MPDTAPAHEPTVVFPARQIVTVNPQQPRAEVVAVRNGRIRAVGARDSVVTGLANAGEQVVVDERFADHVVLPGLIEAHSHVTMTGAFYRLPVYVGAFDRPGPHGTLTGCPTFESVLDRLHRATVENSDGALGAWGFDPSQYPGRPTLDRRALDAVSTDRPVFVMDMSGHGVTVSSRVLVEAGFDASTVVPGVFKGPDGEPTGELAEPAAMIPALGRHLDLSAAALEDGVRATAEVAQRRGLTTISDLLTGSRAEAAAMAAYARSAEARARITSYLSAITLERLDDLGLALLDELVEDNDDRFRVAGVKLMSDGSIQLFTALLRNPPYYDGHPNGLFNLEEKGLVDRMSVWHGAGYQLAIHTNGDGATDRMLDALDALLTRHPRPDHRHRLEHAQMLTPDQIARMGTLGVLANVFAKHLYYWGDWHRTATLGPDRAAQMDPCGSLARAGHRFSIHSDAWVTPIDQLEAMWTAMVRRTRSGVVLGEDERLTLDQALRAVTIDAAFLLGEDRDKGSIEGGKLADLTVVDRPLDPDDPDSVRAAEPVATVLGGRVLPIP
jgi:predicted amidohydrolase YtcJ